jgi:hypothetical protein
MRTGHPYPLAKIVWAPLGAILCHTSGTFCGPSMLFIALCRAIQMVLVTYAQPAGRAEQCFFIARLLPR